MGGYSWCYQFTVQFHRELWIMMAINYKDEFAVVGLGSVAQR